MDKLKIIAKTIFKVISHIVFWSVQITIIFWIFTILFSIIQSIFFTNSTLDFYWFKDLLDSINTLFSYTTPLYGLGLILSLFSFFILPVLTSTFVIWKAYIQKNSNFSVNKILFAEQIPILILALFNIFQGWINVGGIIVMLIFYVIISFRFLIELIGYKLPVTFSKVIRSVCDTTQLIVSSYFSFIMVFPLLIILATLFNFTIYKDSLDTISRENLILTFMSLIGLFLFFPALILTISTPFILSLTTFIKRIKQYNYISIGITTLLLLLFGYGVIYINQNYSPVLNSFENPLYKRILSEKNYEDKLQLKKEIANKYSLEEFKNLTDSEVNDDNYYGDDTFYLNANDIAVSFIEMPMTFSCYSQGNSGYLKENECKKLFLNFERFYVPYRHLLSFLMPLETQLDKNQVKEMLATTIYDYPSEEETNVTEYDTSYESLTINNLTEDITYLENGLIQSEVNILVQSNVSYDDSYQIKFRLPSNSVITGLYTGDSNEKALIVPQNVAEKVYQEELVKSQSFDPTVLSNESMNRYILKVYPVKALSQHKVKITYTALPDYNSVFEVEGFTIYYKNGLTNQLNNLIPLTENINDSNNCFKFFKDSCKSGIYTFDNQTLYRVSELQSFSFDTKNKVVLLLDSSYSMKGSKESYPYTIEGIYTYFKNNGLDVEMYSIDNKSLKINDFPTENDFVGYTNRKLGFNDFLASKGIIGKNIHIIYFTDSSSDIDYNDLDYKSSYAETVNGISLAKETNIISFSSIVLTNSSYDFVMDSFGLQFSQFLDSNNSFINLIPKNEKLSQTDLDRLTGNITTHMLIGQYYNSLKQSNQSSDLPTIQLLDDNSLLAYDLNSLQAFNTNGDLLNNVADNSLIIKGILIKNYTQELSQSFNYKNNNSQRIEIGDEIYNYAIKYKILLPYTSFIGVETDQQKESLEIGMNSINKYANESPGYDKIAFTGNKEVLIDTLLTLLLTISLLIGLKNVIINKI